MVSHGAGHVLLDGITVILRVEGNDRNKMKLHTERLAGLRAQRKLLISLGQGLEVIPKFFIFYFHHSFYSFIENHELQF